jgi:hypothetical protein
MTLAAVLGRPLVVAWFRLLAAGVAVTARSLRKGLTIVEIGERHAGQALADLTFDLGQRTFFGR